MSSVKEAVSAQSPETKDTALVKPPSPPKKKQPYPFYLGGKFVVVVVGVNGQCLSIS